MARRTACVSSSRAVARSGPAGCPACSTVVSCCRCPTHSTSRSSGSSLPRRDFGASPAAPSTSPMAPSSKSPRSARSLTRRAERQSVRSWRRRSPQGALSAQRPWRVAALPSELDLSPLLESSRLTRLTPAARALARPVQLGAGRGTPPLRSAWMSRPSPRLLVIGPPRSGRSNVLEVLGQAAHRRPPGRHRLQPALATAGAGARSRVFSCSRRGRGRLHRPATAHPDLAVLVDDADSLEGGELERALVECVERVDRRSGLRVGDRRHDTGQRRLPGPGPRSRP